ncbi:SGNH/GDSL hydrolase family protein [Nocardioides sp. BYT-33-1]|uniref:SGNH/GDSL hydrolase family protein n=1 Tax=Nocardioides sp. BYT-33-1 TaxID=3416952 RepID=UPI003F533B1E
MMIRLASIGDSLTRAQLSADYVGPLGDLAGGRISARRFGVNGDFAWNLLQRLDEIVSAPADVVTVMIGTNDARASLPRFDVGRWRARKGLPTDPSPGWFRDCLGTVVARLRSETDAQVALASIPVLGQDPNAAPALASTRYSRMIAELAASEDVRYLPVHERQVAELASQRPAAVPFREPTAAGHLATALRRGVLRRSLDSIARERGLLLTVDHIHQNTRGAALIAEVMHAGLTQEG